MYDFWSMYWSSKWYSYPSLINEMNSTNNQKMFLITLILPVWWYNVAQFLPIHNSISNQILIVSSYDTHLLIQDKARVVYWKKNQHMLSRFVTITVLQFCFNKILRKLIDEIISFLANITWTLNKSLYYKLL